MAGLFITGTDTEIGKTHVACALLLSFQKQKLKVIGMKPVASGAQLLEGCWQNEDVLQLLKASNVDAPYQVINPYLFREPASPHIAAALENHTIELETILSCYQQLQQHSELVVVEGVGGWLAPLNEQDTVEDMALALQLPVVMVVGMRLGCLSHALLTAKQIERSGLKLAGWIANIFDDQFAFVEENIQTLERCLNIPLIARMEFAAKEFNNSYNESIRLLAQAK